MRCAICGEPMDVQIDRWLQTNDGGAVHLRCADREAQHVWQLRCLLAIGHLLVITIVSSALIIHVGVVERSTTFHLECSPSLRMEGCQVSFEAGMCSVL